MCIYIYCCVSQIVILVPVSFPVTSTSRLGNAKEDGFALILSAEPMLLTIPTDGNPIFLQKTNHASFPSSRNLQDSTYVGPEKKKVNSQLHFLEQSSSVRSPCFFYLPCPTLYSSPPPVQQRWLADSNFQYLGLSLSTPYDALVHYLFNHTCL